MEVPYLATESIKINTMKNKTYSEAIKRLDEIVEYIDSESPDIDKLIELVKESVELTQFCKKKLNDTDKQLSELIEQLNAS